MHWILISILRKDVFTSLRRSRPHLVFQLCQDQGQGYMGLNVKNSGPEFFWHTDMHAEARQETLNIACLGPISLNFINIL